VARYYFDLREGDEVTRDEEGVNLPNLESVQEEAARALSEMARETVRQRPNGTEYRMSIEVRDDNGPVLQARFTFEVDRPQAQ
jgi:hypothetical protein